MHVPIFYRTHIWFSRHRKLRAWMHQRLQRLAASLIRLRYKDWSCFSVKNTKALNRLSGYLISHWNVLFRRYNVTFPSASQICKKKFWFSVTKSRNLVLRKRQLRASNWIGLTWRGEAAKPLRLQERWAIQRNHRYLIAMFHRPLKHRILNFFIPIHREIVMLSV